MSRESGGAVVQTERVGGGGGPVYFLFPQIASLLPANSSFPRVPSFLERITVCLMMMNYEFAHPVVWQQSREVR